MSFYTVIPGDTWSSISKKFNVSISALELVNRTVIVTPGKILMPGFVIQIPDLGPRYKGLPKVSTVKNQAGRSTTSIKTPRSSAGARKSVFDTEPEAPPVYSSRTGYSSAGPYDQGYVTRRASDLTHAEKLRARAQPGQVFVEVPLPLCVPPPLKMTLKAPDRAEQRKKAAQEKENMEWAKRRSPDPQIAVSTMASDALNIGLHNPDLVPGVKGAKAVAKTVYGFGFGGFKSFAEQKNETGEVDWTNVGIDASKGAFDNLFKLGISGEVLVATATDTTKKSVNNLQENKAAFDGITVGSTVLDMGKQAGNKIALDKTKKLRSELSELIQPGWVSVVRRDGTSLGVRLFEDNDPLGLLQKKAAETLVDSSFKKGSKTFFDRVETQINECFNKNTLACEPKETK